jgi:hypothetical protein
MKDKPNVSKQGIAEDQKRAILDQHNRLRAGVQPPATDLVKLVRYLFHYLEGRLKSKHPTRTFFLIYNRFVTLE